MRALRWLVLAAVLGSAPAVAEPQPEPSAARSASEDDDLAALTALIKKANAELDAGRVQDAIRDLQVAVTGFEHLTGLRRLDDRIAGLAVAQSLLGAAYAKLGRLDAALATLEAALASFAPFHQATHETWTRLLSRPGWEQRADNVLVAFDWYAQVAKAAGQWSKAAAALDEAGRFAEKVGRWSTQRERLEQLAALYQAHPELPDATASRAWAVAGQALAQINEGRPAQALTMLDDAARIVATVPATGEGLRVRANIDAIAAMALQRQDRHAEAIERLERAVTRFERMPGERTRLMACLDHLFGSYYARNDLPRAVATLRRNLELLAKTPDSELAQYDVYDKLVLTYARLQNYTEAKQAHAAAEQLASKHAIAPERRALAAANYAVVLRDGRNCGGALDAFKQAIRYLEEVNDSAARRAAYAIEVARALACLHQDASKVNAAIERGLALAPAGPSGDVLRAKLRLAAAELAARRENRPGMLADACRRVIAELGERPDGAADVAGCLVVVGQDEHRAGRYDDALRRYRAAAELAKRAGARDGKSDNVNEAAPNTKKRATFLINEATALVAADRYAQAVPVLEEIMALEAPARIGNLLQIGVFDRYHYMASEGLSRTAGNRLVALSFLSPQVDARRGLASVLIQKAMFSEIGRIANQAILDSGPAANADWQAQLALRQLVARVVHSWQGSLREMPNSDRHDMLALFEASDALEQRALARVSTRLGAAAWQGPALADVIARLTSSDALVELVRFDPIDPALVKRDVEGLIARPVPAHYGAFVVSGRTRAVQAIDLGEAHVIDDAVAAYRGVLEQQLTGRARLDEFALAVYGARLHELAVAPVLHALGRVKRLYVAPDGQLAVVPFEALSADPEPDAIRYLGEDVEVIYLSTGRDLVRPRVAAATREAWLVGDPAFDASAAELTAHLGSRQAAPSQRNARSGSAANGLWPALPETRALLDAAGAVAARAGLETHVLDRAAASEGNVLRIRRPRLLLLATHGTFNRNTPQIEVTFTRLEISDEKGTQVEGFSEHQLRAGDPLIRSSIILAGANRDTAASRGVPKQIDGATIDAGDGVLTAYEVWGMDLRGTELVALGACESGLGVVEAGGGASQWLGQPQSEVVAGLRQAFLVAGARSIVMSLWRVPVDETTAQMKQFLDGWLGRGLPRYRAFREAQLTALARARQTHRGGHPLWWAGFVYTGDTGE